jgi:hypothetical protein
MELLRKVSASGKTYRIMDDVPSVGYYSIEEMSMYGDCQVWKKVFGCTSDKESVYKEFVRLIEL